MRVRLAAVFMVFWVGCSGKEQPTGPVRPITTADVTALATKWQEAALPCDPDRLSSLIDREAFKKRLTERAPDNRAAIQLVEAFSQTSPVATKVCAWMSHVDRYTYLRVHEVDGHLRAVMRRIIGIGATYHELELTRSTDDQQVRVADVYSYFKGEWISDEFVERLNAASQDPTALASAMTIQKVRMVEDQQPAQALALLDDLPPQIRGLRSIQGWRVKLSQHISMDAYGKALEELFRRFPNDPSVALLQVDGAYLRGDMTGALRFIDTVDAVVGPDPFLDGTRAMMLAARNGPGDLDLAAAKAEHAAQAEPELAIGPWARVSVALAQHQWTKALEQMDDLSRRFGTKLDQTSLRGGMFKELLGTPEYAAWQAQHR